MATDAASLWVLDELEEGHIPPKASGAAAVKADEYPGGIISMVMLDMDDYADKYGNKIPTIP